MPVSRRQFIQIVSASATAAFALDPEKLLWVPGEKKIFIPPARELIYAGEVLAYEYANARALERSNPIFSSLSPRYEVVEGKPYKHSTGDYKTIFIYKNYLPGEYKER